MVSWLSTWQGKQEGKENIHSSSHKKKKRIYTAQTADRRLRRRASVIGGMAVSLLQVWGAGGAPRQAAALPPRVGADTHAAAPRARRGGAPRIAARSGVCGLVAAPLQGHAPCRCMCRCRARRPPLPSSLAVAPPPPPPPPPPRARRSPHRRRVPPRRPAATLRAHARVCGWWWSWHSSAVQPRRA